MNHNFYETNSGYSFVVLLYKAVLVGTIFT